MPDQIKIEKNTNIYLKTKSGKFIPLDVDYSEYNSLFNTYKWSVSLDANGVHMMPLSYNEFINKTEFTDKTVINDSIKKIIKIDKNRTVFLFNDGQKMILTANHEKYDLEKAILVALIRKQLGKESFDEFMLAQMDKFVFQEKRKNNKKEIKL